MGRAVVLALATSVGLWFGCAPKPLKLASKTATPLKMDASRREDSATIKYIAPFKAKLDAEMNRVLVQSIRPMKKAEGESPLGTMVCDAMAAGIVSKGLVRGSVDFAIVNTGGLRSSFPAGSIKVTDVYELMPFENALVLISIKGGDLRQLLAQVAASPGYNFSGARITVAGNKLLTAEVAGLALNDEQVYTMAVSDYILDSAKKFPYLATAKRIESGMTIREAIIKYLEGLAAAGKSLDVQTDGRFTKQS